MTIFLVRLQIGFSRLQIGFSESVAGNIGKEKIKLMIMKDWKDNEKRPYGFNCLKMLRLGGYDTARRKCGHNVYTIANCAMELEKNRSALTDSLQLVML